MSAGTHQERDDEEEEEGHVWTLESSVHNEPVYSLKDGQNGIFNLIASQTDAESFITFTSKSSAVITINGESFNFSTGPVKGIQDVFEILETDQASENKKAAFVGKILGNVKSSMKVKTKLVKPVNQRAKDKLSSSPRTTIKEIEIDNLTKNCKEFPQSKKRSASSSASKITESKDSDTTGAVRPNEENSRKKPKMTNREKVFSISFLMCSRFYYFLFVVTLHARIYG